MSYNITTIHAFRKEAKWLVRKYPSLKKELISLVNQLKENPFQGSPLGNNCYKLRMAISSKGRGKSGGARIITHIHVINTTLYLISIYDKSEQEDITESELNARLKSI